ncbi:hypothetical protein MLP_37990 [Microlunatus phosphovorus NM-1]|uniref:Uncharacterized protein n=1 Tax=Microlunatus phosphovorus (strain ATCC 700054 / DSM 10555 / JCM 9379 / NBRC 101784 / NCIMB 13414 / VKM Ac-1990 / NM-1) TaxID=1032480 RepID=F5XPY2_MICPN|nr:hypothetical protein MLP_37990 [Microlunatus phosphovorus NM-1]
MRRAREGDGDEPALSDGSDLPARLLERRRRVDQALFAVVMDGGAVGLRIHTRPSHFDNRIYISRRAEPAPP